MENAKSDVKSAADIVAPDHDDDGDHDENSQEDRDDHRVTHPDAGAEASIAREEDDRAIAEVDGCRVQT